MPRSWPGLVSSSNGCWPGGGGEHGGDRGAAHKGVVGFCLTVREAFPTRGRSRVRTTPEQPRAGAEERGYLTRNEKERDPWDFS